MGKLNIFSKYKTLFEKSTRMHIGEYMTKILLYSVSIHKLSTKFMFHILRIWIWIGDLYQPNKCAIINIDCITK